MSKEMLAALVRLTDYAAQEFGEHYQLVINARAALAVIAADREQRRGDAAMPIIAYLRSTPEGAPIWSEDCVCQDAVYPISDEYGDLEDGVSMPMVRQSDAQAALAAKDVQIEGLRSVAMELHRLMLVIESSVRHWDPANHAAVMVLITANNAAIAKEADK